VIGLLLALATTTPAKPSVTVHKAPVFVQFNAVDPVGQAFIRKLREALDTSAIYRPVTNAADAQYVIGIVTMDPDDAAVGAGIGQSTVASVTLQLENTKGQNLHLPGSRGTEHGRRARHRLFAVDREIQDLNAQVSIYGELPRNVLKISRQILPGVSKDFDNRLTIRAGEADRYLASLSARTTPPIRL
jgi:hypothetical protein